MKSFLGKLILFLTLFLGTTAIANELSDQLKQIAKESQTYETRLLDIEETLKSLTKDEKEQEQVLNQQKHKLTKSLHALQRISRHYPEAYFINPQTSNQVIQTCILLKSLIQYLEASNLTLRQKVADLAVLKQVIAQERERVKGLTKGLDTTHKKLAKLLEQQKAAEHFAEKQKAARLRIERLSAQSRTLHDLLTNIKETKPKKSPQLTSKGKPSLIFPVAGKVVADYNQKFMGVEKPGIIIEARKGATVTAPVEGEIVFAGPFKGYKNLVIIEHHGGYHTLLSGLKEMHVIAGQTITIGDPIGTLEQTKPSLYLEMRLEGNPINPTPLLQKKEF